MRNIPGDISTKLKEKRQTFDNNSDIRGSVWINRPTTPLTEDIFLEKQKLPISGNLTDVSIAVQHEAYGPDYTAAYVAYIQAGRAKIIRTEPRIKMELHQWTEIDFDEKADRVSIVYNGTMPRRGGYSEFEFITEDLWIFWSDSGILYGRDMTTGVTEELVRHPGLGDISAIRATHSASEDFGLIIFFLLDGEIWYKQYINGEWFDVIQGPSPGNANDWVEITASRTWDYRVILQVRESTGITFNAVTQFMGIGKYSEEHINIRDVDVKSTLTGIDNRYGYETEHISISDVSASSNVWSVLNPTVQHIENTPDELADWGRFLVVSTDVALKFSETKLEVNRFFLRDDRGVIFAPFDVVFSEDLLTMTFEFADFNNARGVCTFGYNPGTITSMADISVEYFDTTFTPANLIPSIIPVPEVEVIWNE